MLSPYPIEHELGIEYYATDIPGIGGTIRKTAEDFIVDEISSPVSGAGPYLVCRLIKRDWDLQHLVKEMAKKLGISHRRISWAGTKDKRALTSQLITIYGVDVSDIDGLSIKDATIEYIGRSRESLSLGMLNGNRFSIWIRDCSNDDLNDRLNSYQSLIETGILNYYGVQRFGVIRPITHHVGEKILLGDYEGAVMVYIGYSFPQEPEITKNARDNFLRHNNPLDGLKELPVHLSYERAMLHYLATHRGDYRGALKVLPPKLLSMFVGAFQSYLFNRSLSHRCGEGKRLDDPDVGDILIFENGKMDIVTPSNLQVAKLHIIRGRAKIGIFMPGSKPLPFGNSSNFIAAKILDEKKISEEQFKGASNFVATTFSGYAREISLKANMSYQVSGNDVHLEFSLLPGQYATSICREIMKVDPLTLI